MQVPTQGEKPVVHLIPTIPVTLKQKFSKIGAGLTAFLGALMLSPVEQWLPHLQTLFGPKAKEWGGFLMAISFFWRVLMDTKDARKLHEAAKSEEVTS